MSKQPVTKKQKFTDYKTKNYFRSNKKQFLEAGQRGFLATCNFREKDCVRECYNILNQYADELYGPPQVLTEDVGDGKDSEESNDILDDLQKEIEAAGKGNQKNKDAPKHRFQVVDTGTTNCVFIKTTLSDPVELGTKIVADIAKTKEQKSRFLLRLIPVDTVCKANQEDILNAAGKLFDKHFLKEGTTFSIVFNKRYNNNVKRDDTIRVLAELVQSKNLNNKVDLKQAAKSVIVEVIKGLCCLSVVGDYFKYKKYNLIELANAKVVEEGDKIKDPPENDVKSSSVEIANDVTDAEGDKIKNPPENDVTSSGVKIANDVMELANAKVDEEGDKIKEPTENDVVKSSSDEIANDATDEKPADTN